MRAVRSLLLGAVLCAAAGSPLLSSAAPICSATQACDTANGFVCVYNLGDSTAGLCLVNGALGTNCDVTKPDSCVKGYVCLDFRPSGGQQICAQEVGSGEGDAPADPQPECSDAVPCPDGGKCTMGYCPISQTPLTSTGAAAAGGAGSDGGSDASGASTLSRGAASVLVLAVSAAVLLAAL